MSCGLCQNLIIKDNGEGGSAGGLAGKLRSLNAQREGTGLLIESLAAVSEPVSANQFLAEARLLERFILHGKANNCDKKPRVIYMQQLLTAGCWLKRAALFVGFIIRVLHNTQ